MSGARSKHDRHRPIVSTISLTLCPVALGLAIFYFIAAIQSEHKEIAILQWAPGLAMILLSVSSGLTYQSTRRKNRDSGA